MKQSKWREQSKNHAKLDDFHRIEQYDIKSENLFKLHIPQNFKNLIDFRDPLDPLLLQVMPSEYESLVSKNDLDDPVGDLQASPVQGVIHKYHGRVLLITTGICAINCRYCFRRNFPYLQNYASANNWQKAIEYIQNHPEVHEVILSGGDPLMLSTKALASLTKQLEDIKHLKTLRIHSRLPLVTPTRITQNFLNWLNSLTIKKVMVLHCNHPNELNSEHHKIMKYLIKTGTLLLNQSVLLKNVNDNSQVLEQLSHKLFDFGVLPYYLNQLDKAKGTNHFRVSDKQAKIIHKQLLEALPGYLVPKLVVEISGKKNKSPLF